MLLGGSNEGGEAQVGQISAFKTRRGSKSARSVDQISTGGRADHEQPVMATMASVPKVVLTGSPVRASPARALSAAEPEEPRARLLNRKGFEGGDLFRAFTSPAALADVKGVPVDPSPKERDQSEDAGGSRRSRSRRNDRGGPGLARRLFLQIPKVCGCWENMRRRRYAMQLRRTREQCERLRQEARRMHDDSAPCGHLQSVEQHLAAVERWLHCSAGSERHPQVDVLTDLALNLGPVAADDEDKFSLQFQPLDRTERLLAKAACSVLSADFYYPGDLFLTSTRVCFFARVMGVEASFSVPWGSISGISLQSAAERESKTPRRGGAPRNFASHGHSLKAVLQERVSFNGQEVKTFKLRIFDPTSLGQLHKCATQFTGVGLFDGLPLTESLAFGSSASNPSFRTQGAGPIWTAEELEKQTTVYQLERRATIWHDWMSPFLPHDAQKKVKWVALGEHYVRHPLLPPSLSLEAAAASESPPISRVEILGGTRSCTWHPVVDWVAKGNKGTTDAQGWQYCADFYVGAQFWYSSVGALSYVRRRKWQPVFSQPPDQPDVIDSEEVNTASFKTTIIAQKGLVELPKGGRESAKEIFEGDCGEVSLQALGATLLAEDWLAEGALLANYWKAGGAYDLQVGPWAVGGAASMVKGKVRSVELRTPLPPAPMCPKETRCASTFHVVAEANRVVLESVNMSLDVPYGECFNVITCDTFTVGEGQRTRIVRTCAVEWVKSTWMKGVIESSVVTEVAKAGAVMQQAVEQFGALARGVGVAEARLLL